MTIRIRHDRPAPPVAFDGDRMSVAFEDFGPAAYALFLKIKALPEMEVSFDPVGETYTVTAPARFAARLGVARPPERKQPRLASHLYPDQGIVTRRALEAKRFAAWCACGYGKTAVGLEYARIVSRKAGGRVLIVTVNEVVAEWTDMARQWYGDKLPLHRISRRRDLKEWAVSGEPGVGITNWEKFNPDKETGEEVLNECRHLSGVVLDEASKLRASGGKQKWSLIKSCKGVEYKLCLTATPAPNELMEFASQAAFLEKMRTENDIIWTFFTRDPVTQKWVVKPHARKAFFEWMSSWSVYIQNPKRYGWRLDHPDVPDPEVIVSEVPPTPEQLDRVASLTPASPSGQLTLPGMSGPLGIVERGDLSQLAKGFLYAAAGTEYVPSNKPKAVAEIVRSEVARGSQVLIWTEYDAETEVLIRALDGVPGVAALTGSVKPKDRPAMLAAFRRGEVRVLLTRSKLLGYGMNLQFVQAMVFSGWTDSYESFHQSVHRAVRPGQTERVRVYIPVVRDLEGDTWDNQERKRLQFEQAVREMEDAYIATGAF